MKRIWNNKNYIVSRATTFTGSAYAMLGFVGTLVPLDECLPNSMPMLMRVIISAAVLICVWLVFFIGASLYVLCKNKVCVLSANNGHALYLQYGDIFSAEEVANPGIRRNIVIPVNRCFDTHVDNQIVSEQTLHGMTLKRLYSSGMFTEESLSSLIETRLLQEKCENLSNSDKPAGKLKRYPVGTIVDVAGVDGEHYFLWALSTFDSNLKAHTTMQDYTLAVQKLIEACNSESEGFSMVLPLVGTGLSRIKKDQCDVLRYLISAFRLNKAEINSDIHIIIREELKDEIAIMSIK